VSTEVRKLFILFCTSSARQRISLYASSKDKKAIFLSDKAHCKEKYFKVCCMTVAVKAL